MVACEECGYRSSALRNLCGSAVVQEVPQGKMYAAV